MLPALWGKHMWFSIHFIAQDYPTDPSPEDMQVYKSFFENLWKVIPCYKCGVNYKRHLLELPIDQHLHSREALFAWTVSLHNIVNSELGKPQMSLDEAKKKYSDPDFNRKVCEAQQVLEKVMQPHSTVPRSEDDPKRPLITWVIVAFILGVMLSMGVMYIVKRGKRKV